MTLNGARHTAHRTAAATVAASEARRRAAAGRLAYEMTKRLHLLADEELVAFAGTVVANCTMRGLTVPDLLMDHSAKPIESTICSHFAPRFSPKWEVRVAARTVREMSVPDLLVEEDEQRGNC